MRNIEMHCHTNRSDGVPVPSELIVEAKRRNIELLCITDHDRASTELVPEIEAAGIATVSSVEISTRNTFEDDRSLHMTYYAQSIPDTVENIIKNTREQKERLILSQLQHLEWKGFTVDIAEFYRGLEQEGRQRSWINKYDIARYIASKVENRKKLLSMWCQDKGKLHMDFYNRCLKRAGDMYGEYGVEIEEYEPEIATISEIARDTGAVFSIAHPNFTFARVGVKWFEKLYEQVYRNMWVTAIEINTKATKKWVDAILWLKEKYGDGLQLTFGSDCHRIGKPDEKHGDLWFENAFVPDKVLENEVLQFQKTLRI